MQEKRGYPEAVLELKALLESYLEPDKIALVLMGTISAAQHEILIITPYFLPSREMIACL